MPAAQTRSGEGLQRILGEQQNDFESSRFGTSPANDGTRASGDELSKTVTVILIWMGVAWVAGLIVMAVTGGRRRVMWYLAATMALLAALAVFAARASAASRSASGGGGSFGGGGGGGSGGGGGGSW